MSIKIEDLIHIYHKGTPLETKALDQISLEIPNSCWMSIVGHTGSGKSTLAQHFNALLMPDAGKIVVDGVEIGKDKKALREIRRTVGLVFQYPEQQLFAETVKEELLFGLKNWKIKGDLDELATSALDQVGLDPSYLERSPFKLSGGEKRRVAIASVLAVNPGYLVLDEPTAGLDAKGKELLLELLKHVHQNGKAVIMVTHDLEVALKMSDRIVAIEGGHLACQGTPDEVSRRLWKNPVKGLELPDIIRFWLKLEEEGIKVPFSWNLKTFTADITRLVM